MEAFEVDRADVTRAVDACGMFESLSPDVFDDLPEIASLRLRPVVVSPQGTTVLSATMRLARPLVRTDLPARRLLG